MGDSMECVQCGRELIVSEAKLKKVRENTKNSLGGKMHDIEVGTICLLCAVIDDNTPRDYLVHEETGKRMIDVICQTRNDCRVIFKNDNFYDYRCSNLLVCLVCTLKK